MTTKPGLKITDQLAAPGDKTRCEECSTTNGVRRPLVLWPDTAPTRQRTVAHDGCFAAMATRAAAWWYAEHLYGTTKAGCCAVCQTTDFSAGKWLIEDGYPAPFVTPELCITHAGQAEAAHVVLVNAASGRTTQQ